MPEYELEITIIDLKITDIVTVLPDIYTLSGDKQSLQEGSKKCALKKKMVHRRFL